MRERLEEIKEHYKEFKEGSTLQYNLNMEWLIAEVERLLKLGPLVDAMHESHKEQIDSLIRERDELRDRIEDYPDSLGDDL